MSCSVQIGGRFLSENQKIKSPRLDTASFAMHNSLNILAQRISKISVRSSLQTDNPLPANETTIKPLPPLPHEISRSRTGRPTISLPVSGSFVDLCKSEGSSREAPPNHSPGTTKRKQSEMPLSCHPPFQQSWIEVQPLHTCTVKIRTDPRPNIKQSSTSAPGLSTNGYKEPPRATSSRPYHGVLLPPPPLPPSAPLPKISERRKRPHSKSPRARYLAITPTNLFQQPIAPLTPRQHNNTTLCPTEPRCLSGPDLTAGLHTSVENIPGHSYIPLPDALHDRWAKRKSSHVILADNSLQLQVFSGLSVELDEVLGLYTTGKTS